MSQSPKLASSLARSVTLLSLLSSGCMVFDFVGDAPKGGSASSTGGTGGAGGADSSSSGLGNYELVDNMEDGTLAVMLPHWQGTAPAGWDLNSDGTGKLTSPMGGVPKDDIIQQLPKPRGYSERAMHLAGTGFTDWGADMTLALNRWDVSAFKGIKFWARTDTPMCNSSVILHDINTVMEGGICTSCYDGFVRQFKYTAAWTQYTVAFDAVTSGGWGMPPQKSLDTKNLWLINFRTLGGCAFDVWIDDIELYR